MGHTKSKTRKSKPAIRPTKAAPKIKPKVTPRQKRVAILPFFCEAWEVRAIRAKRKTQFREALDPQPDIVTKDGIPIIYIQLQQVIDGKLVQKDGPDDNDPDTRFCETLKPKYPKGTILWVREDFAKHYHAGTLYPEETFVYQADYPNGISDTHDYGLFDWREGGEMRIAASRLAIRITGHRMQFLHDISDEDCIAEGMNGDYLRPKTGEMGSKYQTVRAQFLQRYEAFHGPKSSQENVYVWAYNFEIYEFPKN
jgi:hypothetical protein